MFCPDQTEASISNTKGLILNINKNYPTYTPFRAMQPKFIDEIIRVLQFIGKKKR